MWPKIINEKIFCGIDIGTKEIKACLLKFQEAQRFELLGVYEIETAGFHEGSVTDITDFAECIHQIVHNLSEKSGTRVKQVNLGISSDLIDIRETNAVMPLIDKGTKVIVKKDIRKINEQVRLLATKMDEEVLHDLPLGYVIDDQNTALNPEGLYGRKMSVKSLMAIINSNCLRNIVKAVNQAGFDVNKVSLSSYAASDIIISPEEKMRGSVLIDIGSNMTTVIVFKDKLVKFIDKINVGGNNFTKSIADRLELPFDLAEEIKKSYAVASKDVDHQEEEILVKRESQYIPVRRSDVCRSIDIETNHLVESIKTSLRISGYYHQINGGVYIIGGGAALHGLVERIAESINFPVELGQVNIPDQKNIVHSASFASVMGIARNAAMDLFQDKFEEQKNENWAKQFSKRITHIYQEYF